MDNQPEALRLADACDNLLNHADNSEVVPYCAAELRRLHAENERLRAALTPFARVTLTDNGLIIGLMREDIDRARAALKEQK